MSPTLLLLAFVVRPLAPAPDLHAVADRAHAWTVFVTASGGGVKSSASGVLIGGGLVLTDLHGLLTREPGGAVVPAEITVVVDGVGPLPARLAGIDAALGIAVLRLPDQARGLPGAAIAAVDPDVADELLAMGTDGTSVNVLGVKVDHIEGGVMLRTSAALPASFRGGPLFDARGNLAALELPEGAAAASSVLHLLEQR